MFDREFYNKASINNTFDLEAVEKSLNDIQISSFKYLYDLQITSTGLKRFDFTMDELTYSERIDLDVRYYPRSWVYTLQDNFINYNKRLDFKRSKFYNKYISFNDVISNPDVFSNIFLLYIDGKLYNNIIHLLCKEDKTIIIFNLNERPADTGLKKEVLLQMMNDKKRATLFILPHHKGGSLSLNQYSYKNYNNMIPLSEFNINNDFNPKEKYMCTITDTRSFETKVCTVDNDAKNLYMLDSVVADSHYKSFIMDIFNLKHVFKTIQIPIDEEWFSLEIQECPIATHNTIILDDYNNLLHDVKLELYYPNIYHVIGDRPKNTALKILVFYYDDTDHELLHYDNHLAVYYKYVSNVLEKYKNNTILDIIKNYKPVECKYTINNFKESIWFDDHFKFKSEYLRELIKEDGNNFIKYLKRQCDNPSSFYLNMNMIDLDSRLRNDNKDLLPYVDYEEFDEPRYMFVFKNEFRASFTDIIFTLDGINYIPDKYYYMDRFEVLYIPTSLVKDDSLLEVEKIKKFLHEDTVTFKSLRDSKIMELNIPSDKVIVYHNDIFITDAETNEYLEDTDYMVSVLLDGEWKPITNDCFYEIEKQYKIDLRNTKYINKRLKVHVKKNYAREHYTISNLEETNTLLTFAFNMNDDARHIRLYKNGRVVPRSIYYPMLTSGTVGGFSYILLARKKEIGETYTVECVPYKMKEVFFAETVNNNQIIDLYGKIDKPLNLKWFDFYLNGRKLTKNNLEFISPCKLILRNVNSNSNLSIVQNDRDDDEWYGLYSPTDIIDKILSIENFIPEGNNKDDEDDFTGEKVDIIEDLIYDFWIKFLSRFGFINPDWSQIPNNIVKWYDPIFVKPNMIFKINPDRGIETAVVYRKINPDEKRVNKPIEKNNRNMSKK